MKKTILLLALCLLFALPALAFYGEGTAEAPIGIEEAAELKLISDFPDLYFELANDIELNEDWEPLCVLGEPFTGVFDGKGHTISGLFINNPYSFSGLFSKNEGVILNVNVQTESSGMISSFFQSRKSFDSYTGILVGYNDGVIENCSVSGIIIHSIALPRSSCTDRNNANYYIGGIAGYSSGSINNCSSNFSIRTEASFDTFYTYLLDSHYYFGGIVGKNVGTIQCVFANTELTALNAYYNYNSKYPKNYAYSYGYFGGIAGTSTGIIINSCAWFQTTTTNSQSNIAGSQPKKYYNFYLYGITDTGEILSSYSRGSSSGEKNAVFGASSGAQVNSVFYDKQIAGVTDTGHGTPTSTSAMKLKLTYTRAGWDFDNIWAINKDVNDGYPYLQWMYPDETQQSKALTETSASVVDGKLFFETVIDRNALGKFIQIALYKPDGRLSRVFIVPNYRNKKELVVAMDDDGSATAKVFVWSTLESLDPLGKAEAVTIVR